MDMEVSGLAIDRVSEPSSLFRRSTIGLEVLDPHRRHAQVGQSAADRIDSWEIHQREVAPELALVGDTFVVVEEVAAPVENQLPFEYLYRADMVRRVAMDDIGASADKPTCESHMPLWYVVPPVATPMNGGDDDVARALDPLDRPLDPVDGPV